MTNVFLVQLVGVILFVAGLIALAASTHLFGPRLSPAEKRMASDEWNRRRDKRRLPVNFEALVSALLLSGGLFLLIWSQFGLCDFLTYWIPSFPYSLRLFLSCN